MVPPYAIVGIKNRESGAFLDHFNKEGIAGCDFERHKRSKEGQWYRIPVDVGYVAYKNCASGKFLGCSLGRLAQAFEEDDTQHRVHWKESDTADGFFELQNRATGAVLCFESSTCVKVASTGSGYIHQPSPATQWAFEWHRNAPVDGIGTIRSVGLKSLIGLTAVNFRTDVDVKGRVLDFHGQTWRRIDVGAGYVAYKNVDFDLVLGHRNGAIVAVEDNYDHQSVHWKEIPIDGDRVCIQNRATHAFLRFERDDRIAAVAGAHWQSDPETQWSLAWAKGTRVIPTLKRDAIVAIKSRASGVVIDHHCAEHIAAYDNDCNHPNHQWYRVPVDIGYVAYKNVGTGNVLTHSSRSIVDARSNEFNEERAHWKEVDGGDGGFTIQNRLTAAYLRFESCDLISAVVDEADQSTNWLVVEIRPATK